MLEKSIVFDDGSMVTWLDRESVRYTSQDIFVVDIWVDYKGGVVISDRAIKSELLRKWTTAPEGTVESDLTISQDIMMDILKKLGCYYKKHGVKLVVE